MTFFDFKLRKIYTINIILKAIRIFFNVNNYRNTFFKCEF